MDTLLDLLGSSRPTLPDPAFVTRLNVALALLIGSESKSIYLGSAIFKILASLSFFFAGLGKALNASFDDASSVYPLLTEFAKGRLWTQDRYAFCLALGLGFSVLGDILLIPSRENYYKFLKTPTKKGEKSSASEEKAEGDTMSFKAGTFFFALAHIAYTVAFLNATASKSSPFNWTHFGIAAVFGLGSSGLLGILGGGLHMVAVPKDMEPLVRAYVFIITGMVAVASATDNGWQKIAGAVMFMVSDMFVAVDVFGKKTPSDPTAKRRGRDGWMFRSVGWIFYFWAQMVLAGTV